MYRDREPKESLPPKDSAADTTVKEMASLAQRASRLADEVQVRLASVTRSPSPTLAPVDGRTRDQPPEYSPLFNSLRHHGLEIHEALDTIESVLRRCDL